MKIHEYKAKELLKKFGVPVPRGIVARSPDEAREIARAMLGMKLITHQTGPEGREVRVLLVEEGLPIDKEFYLGIVLDRASGRPVFMASAAGGMDIEEVAANTPERIFKETIDPA